MIQNTKPEVSSLMDVTRIHRLLWTNWNSLGKSSNDVTWRQYHVRILLHCYST